MAQLALGYGLHFSQPPTAMCEANACDSTSWSGRLAEADWVGPELDQLDQRHQQRQQIEGTGRRT